MRDQLALFVLLAKCGRPGSVVFRSEWVETQDV